MKYKYKKLSKTISRPIIKVRLGLNNQSFLSEALVDSGADDSIFHSDFATLLGIDLKSGIKQETGGIVAGQKACYYLHKVELDLDGNKNEALVGFMENFPTNAGASGVLGHNSFFKFFKIIFDTQKEELEVRPPSRF